MDKLKKQRTLTCLITKLIGEAWGVVPNQRGGPRKGRRAVDYFMRKLADALTTSGYYRTQLLYTYDEIETGFSEQSQIFMGPDVLGRRVEPNSNNLPNEKLRKEDPKLLKDRLRGCTSHRLLERLCQLHHKGGAWRQARVIRRSTPPIIAAMDPDLQWMEAESRIRRDEEEDSGYSKEIAATLLSCQQQYGRLYLEVGEEAIELAEMLNLYEVLLLIPPLVASLWNSFSDIHQGVRLLGIDPERWSELSMEQVREIGVIRAKALRLHHSRQHEETDPKVRFAEVWKECNRKTRKKTGYLKFADFESSDLGQEVLKRMSAEDMALRKREDDAWTGVGGIISTICRVYFGLCAARLNPEHYIDKVSTSNAWSFWSLRNEARKQLLLIWEKDASVPRGEEYLQAFRKAWYLIGKQKPSGYKDDFELFLSCPSGIGRELVHGNARLDVQELQGAEDAEGNLSGIQLAHGMMHPDTPISSTNVIYQDELQADGGFYAYFERIGQLVDLEELTDADRWAIYLALRGKWDGRRKKATSGLSGLSELRHALELDPDFQAALHVEAHYQLLPSSKRLTAFLDDFVEKIDRLGLHSGTSIYRLQYLVLRRKLSRAEYYAGRKAISDLSALVALRNNLLKDRVFIGYPDDSPEADYPWMETELELAMAMPELSRKPPEPIQENLRPAGILHIDSQSKKHPSEERFAVFWKKFVSADERHSIVPIKDNKNNR